MPQPEGAGHHGPGLTCSVASRSSGFWTRRFVPAHADSFWGLLRDAADHVNAEIGVRDDPLAPKQTRYVNAVAAVVHRAGPCSVAPVHANRSCARRAIVHGVRFDRGESALCRESCQASARTRQMRRWPSRRCTVSGGPRGRSRPQPEERRRAGVGGRNHHGMLDPTLPASLVSTPGPRTRALSIVRNRPVSVDIDMPPRRRRPGSRTRRFRRWANGRECRVSSTLSGPSSPLRQRRSSAEGGRHSFGRVVMAAERKGWAAALGLAPPKPSTVE